MGVADGLSPDVMLRVRKLLADQQLDGWLLFDFHGLNPVATRVLQLGGMATRRLFVFVPAVGPPTAVVHRIELQRVRGFPGEVRPYAAWRELERELSRLLSGKRVAMEYSARDRVPYLDRVPAGVVELVRACGAEVQSSSELVTAVASRWSRAELANHRRAAERLREIAVEAFARVRSWYGEGTAPTEQGLQRWLLEALDRSGLYTSDDPIVAAGEHSADPHHEPIAGLDTVIEPGDVLLLDLWAAVAQGTVFADQTWMGFVGGTPPSDVARVFEVVRDARDRVVALLEDKWREGWSITGAELDDTARRVIASAGFAEYVVHRTGHSIDRELHGSGPHLDNFETHDDRKLIAGIGFSVEPGIYLPGRFGVRSEINVVLHEEGPEVTPAEPQRELICLDVAGR